MDPPESGSVGPGYLEGCGRGLLRLERGQMQPRRLKRPGKQHTLQCSEVAEGELTAS